MPLKTETIDLRDERDRLDDELDALAARGATVNLRLQGMDDELESPDAVALARERNEIQQEAAETQTHLAGVAWAIDEFGERVATDGGTSPDALKNARLQMESDTGSGADGDATNVVSDEPAPEEIPSNPLDTVSGANAGAGTDTGAGTEATTTATDDPEPASDDLDPAGDLTVTFGGLTAGEYARVADLADASNRQQIGFAQGSQSDQGATRNILVAAGTTDAPYFAGGMDLKQQANAVGDCSVNYVEWCESRIMDLTSPPESVGNAYADRVQAVMEAQQEDTDQSDMESNPT